MLVILLWIINYLYVTNLLLIVKLLGPRSVLFAGFIMQLLQLIACLNQYYTIYGVFLFPLKILFVTISN